jgi:hypothetical protein
MILKEDFVWSLDLKGQYPSSDVSDSIFELMKNKIVYITDLNQETNDDITSTITTVINELYPHLKYRLKITFSIKNMCLKQVVKEDLLDYLGNGELHWVNVLAIPHHFVLSKREFINV